LALKGNKGNLHEQVKDHFKIEQNNNFTGLKHDYHSEYDKGHGRIEHRECWTTNQIDWIVGITDWPHFSDYGEGKEIARSVRSHWSIANFYELFFSIRPIVRKCRHFQNITWAFPKYTVQVNP
jgi:predicted transposase YbfD/YdcC